MKKSNAFIQLLRYTKPHKVKIAYAILCSTLNKIADIVPEILIGLSIDVIVNQQHSLIAGLGIVNPFWQIYVLGILTAAFWICESVFEYLYSITWHSLAQEIQQELRLKTYARLQNLDLAYFSNHTSGALLNILQEDINQLEQFLSRGPNEIIQLTVNVIVMGLIFLYLSPLIALLTLIPIPFVIIISYYFQHRLAHLYEVVRQTSAQLASHIAYRLQGITTIKSYTTEDYELAQLKKESNRYQMANHQATQVSAIYIPVVRMAVMVGFIMSLVVGGIYALQGKIPINWYAALVFLTQRFLWPFTTLTTITDMYERSLACAKRILGILNSSQVILDGTEPLDNKKVQGAIAFNNVSFEYQNGTKIFTNISFKIPSRNTIAFVGATGSGKSTIIKLLLRFYDPNSGTITIAGQDITKVHLKDLRASIGLVSQDMYVIDGTIAENIAYGSFNASGNDIIGAAKMAQADHFIKTLSQGYDTKVEQYGKNLSGGQIQRLSIARAILKKSPILIFDEATSALDNETESAFVNSIAQLKKDHTIIIIAHRLSTTRHADTIIVLDKGDIVETGSHKTLLEKNGFYANLWNKQF